MYPRDVRHDLVTLHLGDFRGEKKLLLTCLEAYGWTDRDDKSAETMVCFTPLHDFDVLEELRDIGRELH